MANKDYMVRAMAEESILAFAVTSQNMTEAARVAHHTSPIATAALGRLLSGAVMMGDMLKNEDDKLTLQISGDGPMGGLLVTADNLGNAKGYVNNPAVIMPAREDGHLNVGGAIGAGTLTVIKDMGLENPYNGHVPLFSGEIAEDLTHYFLNSEQTPSSVGLGVLINREDMSVSRAGGFIIQVMPGAKDSVLDIVESNLASIGSVTDRLSENDDPKYLLELLLKGLSVKYTNEKPVQFLCDCERDRVRRALALLGEVELTSMIKDGKPIELKCQFCNKGYSFDIPEIEQILKERQTILK